MAKTYYEGQTIKVRDFGVTTSQGSYKVETLGPTRIIERRGNSLLALNICSNTGQTLETVVIGSRYETDALNIANAINQLVSDFTGAPLVTAHQPPPAQRSTCGLMMMIAGGIVAAVVILWLLTVIF